MADNETIADIIAEMRGMGNYQRYSGDHARVLAGRIEAAHKREKAAIEADALEVGGIVEAAHRRELSKNVSKNEANFGQLGDAAKLRKALKHIKDRLPHMLQYMRVHWEDASAGGYFDELMLVINAALSTPPRNCDLPEVAKDPWRAWLNDKSNWEEGYPKLEIHDWLLAPATAKEGGAK